MTRQNINRFAVRIVLAVSLISSVQANASIEDADRAIKAARYAEGIAELRRLTATGNARAEAELGWMTLMGIGLPRDPAKAKAMITHAAGTGGRFAQLVLAAMLIASAPDAGNDAQAERIVRKLAEQGDAGAQAYLGQLYVFGRGVPRDPAQAAHWIQLSAAQHNDFGVFLLGALYDAGTGVPLDSVRAVALYRDAAQSTSCAPVPQSRSHHARLRRRNLALPFAPHQASGCVRIEGIVCVGGVEDRSLPTETPLRNHNEGSWHAVPRGRQVAHVLPTGPKDPVRVAIGGTREAMTVPPSWFGQAACRPDPVTSGATAAGSSLRLSRGLPSGKRGCRSAG